MATSVVQQSPANAVTPPINHSAPQADEEHEFDAEENACILSDVFKENNVYLGGSAIGRGFRRSARYYLQNIVPKKHKELGLENDAENENADESLLENVPDLPPEDSFYVFDLGVVVYQYYNWCRFFPRVQPYYAVKCNPGMYHVSIPHLTMNESYNLQSSSRCLIS